MSGQGESATDELRALRARAYGPDADIQDDPVALRRLSELEQRARPAVTAAAAPGQDAAMPRSPGDEGEPERHGTRSGGGTARPFDEQNEPGRVTGAQAAGGQVSRDAAAGEREDARASPPAVDGSVTDQPVDDDDAAAPRTPWWRRRATLWIASVALAAVVASAVTLAALPLAAGRVTVLQIDGGAETPPSLGAGSRSVVFEEFFGLIPVVMPQEWTDDPTLDCIFIEQADDDAGARTGGCAGGGFPPTAGLIVSPSFPDELRERFGDGTALQFVADGSQVHVYAKQPVGERTP